ncbi:hypothetical protein SPURM210S_03308 [Streptomyces purpurascens]
MVYIPALPQPSFSKDSAADGCAIGLGRALGDRVEEGEQHLKTAQAMRAGRPASGRGLGDHAGRSGGGGDGSGGLGHEGLLGRAGSVVVSKR